MKDQIWTNRTTGETAKVLDKVGRLVMVQDGNGHRVHFLSLFKLLYRR